MLNLLDSGAELEVERLERAFAQPENSETARVDRLNKRFLADCRELAIGDLHTEHAAPVAGILVGKLEAGVVRLVVEAGSGLAIRLELNVFVVVEANPEVQR